MPIVAAYETAPRRSTETLCFGWVQATFRPISRSPDAALMPALFAPPAPDGNHRDGVLHER